MPEESRLTSRLKLNEFKLNTLLDVTKAINENYSISKLLELYEFIVRQQLGIGKVILFSNKGAGWEIILKYGTKRSERFFNVEDDLLHIREITVVESSTKGHLNVFDVVIPVYHKSLPLAYLLLGDLDEEILRISPVIKHLSFVQTLTNIISVAIENKRLANENIQQERTKKELELASEMQSMLFPGSLPDDNAMQADAFYQPHQKIGGDYYDFIRLNKNEVVFCLADVSGKGISAALLMANFQANLRAMLPYKSRLTDLVKDLNAKVMESAKGEKYVTLFIGKYKLKERILEYVNAAHVPPYIHIKGKLKSLRKGCTGIGMFEKIPAIEQGKIKIPANAFLVCHTDGVAELESEDKELFGSGRLKQLLIEHNHLSMKQLNQRIFETISEFKGKQPFIDDIALLSCRFF